jgi:lipopolysaccharide transport system permease protein
MLTHLKTLAAHRDLLWMWTLREIKVRYKQSLLGAAWAIVQPLSMTVVFTVVFSLFARFPTDGVPYVVFSYTALLPWTLLQSSLSFGAPSLVNNMNLVSKIYFPREILPIAVILASLVDFFFGSLVMLGLLAFYRIPLHGSVLWLPLLLGIQVLLMVGITLLASAVNVFYRDIRFVVPLALQVWMYLSPVVYPLSLVPERFRPYYLLNPMSMLIVNYRRVLLEGQPPLWNYTALGACMVLLLLVIGYGYFKRLEPTFADII